MIHAILAGVFAWAVLSATITVHAVQPPAEGTRQPGVTVRTYQLEGAIEKIPTLKPNQTPNADEVRDGIDLVAGDFPGFGTLVNAPFLTRVIGWLTPPVDGEYVFRLTSDDGSRLSLGGALVLAHDGRHGTTSKESEGITLEAGKPIEVLVEHFDAGGNRRLRLEWMPPGSENTKQPFVEISTRVLTTEIDNARVVAPGVKAVMPDVPPRAGDGVPVAGMHPSFSLVTPVIDAGGLDVPLMIGAMATLADGRVVIGTFNPLQRDDVNLPDIESKVPDRLYAISGLFTPGAKPTLRPCADNVLEPLGLCVIGDDLYVAHRRAVTRLRDLDGDGFFEDRYDVAGGARPFGWEAWNYHQFTFGLLHHNGSLYTGLSTAMAPPPWEGMGTNAAPNDPLRGSILQIDLASGAFRTITSGVRTPNGLGFGLPEVDGTPNIFYVDNQGAWMATNNFGHVSMGRFFGHFNNTNVVPKLAERFPKGGIASAWADRPRAVPAADLVHNDLANSPTQMLMIEDDTSLFQGQMLVGELTAGGIRRVALEKVAGQWQGASFQFAQGFSVGVNRLAWGPPNGDSRKGRALVAGGIGAGGNWNWKGTKAGLDVLTSTGQVAFEMRNVRATPTGFDIEFTKSVDPAWLGNTANYTVQQWTYTPSKQYGGAKQHQQTLTVTSARSNERGDGVRLTIPGLIAGRTVRLRLDPVSTRGEPIWATEAFYALNMIPVEEDGLLGPVSGARRRNVPMGVGAMAPANASVLIGRSARTHFSTPNETPEMVRAGRTQNDLLAREYADVGEGDLLSRASFGDCHLHVEWYAPPGGAGQMAGNSGVYIQDRYEIQVLGTPVGAAPLAKNEAGAIYNVKAVDVNASTGPGTWQAYDIFFTAPRFDGKTKEKTASARITMYWNGQLVHDGIGIDGPTGAARAKGESVGDRAATMQVGPVRLQAHATDAQGPVRYRNVWVAPIPIVRGWGFGDLREAAYPPLPPWVDLLDPKATGTRTLEAFETRGGSATYTIEGDTIVGTSVPRSPNTFLLTKQQFGDFDLLVDVQVDAEMNSGIQIRSHVDGTTAEEPLGARSARVSGYQVEIDPTARAFTGGIYDEARRGWLVPLTENPAARSAFKPGAWNQIQVMARGPWIQTWINGVPAATLFDAVDARGHIGLQVHDVGDREDPLSVRFRNVRVRSYDAGGK